jgi:hypothetical protein
VFLDARNVGGGQSAAALGGQALKEVDRCGAGPRPDIRSTHINIDTGAYVTGRLKCRIIEDSEIFVL